ncbi:UNVERIFIED_CONTAM: hypothetical protein FKN15_060228 [Acipenser sinensis]
MDSIRALGNDITALIVKAYLEVLAEACDQMGRDTFLGALHPLNSSATYCAGAGGATNPSGCNILHVVSESVGAPTTLEMETIEELIAMIKRNTAAQQEQNKKWRVELGLPEPEPTDLDRLLQKWKVELPPREPEEEELPLPEPRGEELPLFPL